jgi:hypothetical protein
MQQFDNQFLTASECKSVTCIPTITLLYQSTYHEPICKILNFNELLKIDTKSHNTMGAITHQITENQPIASFLKGNWVINHMQNFFQVMFSLF